jgi:hypothetical protein
VFKKRSKIWIKERTKGINFEYNKKRCTRITSIKHNWGKINRIFKRKTRQNSIFLRRHGKFDIYFTIDKTHIFRNKRLRKYDSLRPTETKGLERRRKIDTVFRREAETIII